MLMQTEADNISTGSNQQRKAAQRQSALAHIAAHTTRLMSVRVFVHFKHKTAAKVAIGYLTPVFHMTQMKQQLHRVWPVLVSNYPACLSEGLSNGAAATHIAAMKRSAIVMRPTMLFRHRIKSQSRVKSQAETHLP